MKFYLIIGLLFFSSCVIIKRKDYDQISERGKENITLRDSIKNKIYSQLQNKEGEVCDLRFLFKLLSQKFIKSENIEFDADRINLIKFEIYKAYKDNITIRVTEAELKQKIGCYLDYMLDPKNKPVPFIIFWEDSYYRKFNCQ